MSFVQIDKHIALRIWQILIPKILKILKKKQKTKYRLELRL